MNSIFLALFQSLNELVLYPLQPKREGSNVAKTAVGQRCPPFPPEWGCELGTFLILGLVWGDERLSVRTKLGEKSTSNSTRVTTQPQLSGESRVVGLCNVDEKARFSRPERFLGALWKGPKRPTGTLFIWERRFRGGDSGGNASLQLEFCGDWRGRRGVRVILSPPPPRRPRARR